MLERADSSASVEKFSAGIRDLSEYSIAYAVRMYFTIIKASFIKGTLLLAFKRTLPP
jgi:hypothetical protein